MRRLAVLLLLLILPALACGGTHDPLERVRARAVPGGAFVQWHVLIGKDLKLTESVCWGGFSPGHIRPEMPAALPFAQASSQAGTPLALDAAGVGTADTAGCMRLTIDLDRMARSLDHETAVMRIGDAIYGSFDTWLWRPSAWPKGMRGKLVVEAPPQISVSLPHHRERDRAYEIPLSTWSYMARSAIGLLNTDELHVAGTDFSVVSLPEATPRASREGIRRFIEGAALGVATLDGRMPTSRVQVLLRSGQSGRSDPIQFGMAMRGGGSSIALRISPAATDQALYGEWIATHELSHLWLPPVDHDGAWLSEGFASYYQCVLRSRVGMYEEARAWDELISGFERGRAQAGELPLREARRPSYQHIYWGGAAILFKLDVELRKHGQSLDAVAASVRRSTPVDDEETTADAMVTRFERAAGRELRSLVDTWLEQPFADTAEELRDARDCSARRRHCPRRQRSAREGQEGDHGSPIVVRRRAARLTSGRSCQSATSTAARPRPVPGEQGNRDRRA